MKKILIGALVVIVVLVAALAIAIARQPDEYHVVREATIAAPASVVFAEVNDFHKWDDWSPWAKLDPKMQVTYSGPDSGKGAGYAWQGNSDVGKGSMTIIDSQPSNAVKIDLHFIEPFDSSSITDFNFRPAGDSTAVSWSMTGKHNLMSKAMCLVMDMDKMIGPDFEKGLSQLKTVAEAKK
jgi:opacity protein-like surface antigen